MSPLDGACGSGATDGTGKGCFGSIAGSSVGGPGDMLVLLLAVAAFRVARRRLA